VSEVGHGKEIGAEVRDIEDILQDAYDPSSFSVHVDMYMACGNGWDATVVAKHNLGVVGEGIEGCEPGAV